MSFRPIILSAALSLLLVSAAGAAETFELKLRLRPGDRWAFVMLADVQSSRSFTAGERVQEQKQARHQQRKGTIEVLDAKDGTPTAIRIAFDKDCQMTVESGGNTSTVAYPLAGQTVTLRRESDGRISNDVKADLPAPLLDELAGSLRVMETVPYPSQPVAVGDEWDAGRATIARYFNIGPDDPAKLHLRLKAVREVAGRRVADMEASGSATRIDEEFVENKMAVTSTITVDLATGLMLDQNATATSKLSGSKATTAGGEALKVTVQGEGKIQHHSTDQILPPATQPAGGGK